MRDNADLDEIMAACHVCWPDLELVSTRNPRKALCIIQESPPDIVVMDLYIDNHDNFNILQQIRTCSDVPVLALSFLPDPAQVVKALELGADGYITKPFDQMELVAHIRAILRNRVKMDITPHEHASTTRACAAVMTSAACSAKKKPDHQEFNASSPAGGNQGAGGVSSTSGLNW